MIRIKEVIVVEGRYDKNTLSQLIDGTIIETEGFGIFSDKEKLALLRRLAEKHGLIITAGSDFHGKCKPAIHYGELVHPYPLVTCERLNQLIYERGGQILA